MEAHTRAKSTAVRAKQKQFKKARCGQGARTRRGEARGEHGRRLSADQGPRPVHCAAPAFFALEWQAEGERGGLSLISWRFLGSCPRLFPTPTLTCSHALLAMTADQRTACTRTLRCSGMASARAGALSPQQHAFDDRARALGRQTGSSARHRRRSSCSCWSCRDPLRIAQGWCG